MALKKLHFVVIALATGALAAAYWLQNPGAFKRSSSASTATATPATAAAPATGDRSGPVAVEVAKVEAADLKDETQAIGTLRSKQGVMLR
ncbi:MAG: efflux transporter periplasmic adaptor subunit, partial [Burkholderiaceae bacterium]